MISTPFFIIGIPRSGTTLLANILNRNTEICIPPETRYYFQFYESTRFPIKENDLDDEIGRSVRFDRIRDLNLDPNDLKELLQENTSVGSGDFFKSILISFRNRYKPEAKVFGEKSPGHLRKLKYVFEDFPDAKVIIVVRDGRDCVNSLMNVPWQREGIYKQSLKWSYRMRLIRSAISKWNKNIIVVKFEEFVTDPGKVREQLADFVLGDYTGEWRDSQPDLLVPEWENEWKGKVNDAVDSKRVHSWKNSDSDLNNYIMTRIMKNELREFGYETPEFHISLSKRIVFYLKRLIYNSAVYKLELMLKGKFVSYN